MSQFSYLLKTGRPLWAMLAACLSTIAIVAELCTGICKNIFDPLPDAWCIGAYAFLIVMLLYNEVTLRTLTHNPRHVSVRARLSVALVGTSVALAIAAVYTVMFLPAFPLSIFALLLFGLGVGAWSPMINLTVLLLQLRALLWYRKELDPIVLRRLWLSVGAFAAVMLLWCVVLPLASHHGVHAVVARTPGHRMFSTWWEYIHGRSPFASD